MFNEAHSTPTPSSASKFTRAYRRRRVLIAEDDSAIRRMMSSVLRADAFHVDEVADGGALVEQLASMLLETGRCAYDLLVVDIRMPRIDGLQVLAGLQRAGWYPPVVVVTADSAARDRAMNLGARAVFEKPFDVDDFRTAAMYYSKAA